MKSRLSTMLQIWEAAISDCGSACATTIVEMQRDIATLRRSVTSRGLGTFVLDLPLLDDTLLSLLENGSVRFSGHLHGRRSKKDLRPRFLWAFWSLVSDASGCLLQDPDPDAIRSIRQLSCLFKKLEVACSSDRLKKAVEEFHEIESKILSPINDWSGDDPSTFELLSFKDSFSHIADTISQDSASDRDGREFVSFLGRLDRVSRILTSGLPVFDSMSNNDDPSNGYFRHGRGVVSNLSRKEYKYTFRSWSDKLEGVFPFDWCTGQPLGSFPSNSSESPGKLAAVPKTAKGPRLIASEPVEHQWCQQKIFTYLDYAFSKSLIGKFVDLHDQEKSQVMVASASIDQSLCTIDLSSASDRISCRHIESLMREHRSLFEAFYAVRTRTIKDAVVSNKVYPVRKFTTMGSTLTFPVQCLFFLSVALASAGAHDVKSIRALIGSVRVFGDDIIAPNSAYVAITRNLTLLGLKVNEKKSFSKGFFRESCGADYWRGFDVTPCKPKGIGTDTPYMHMATLDASNNLYLKGYWKAADVVLKLLPLRMRDKTFGVHDGVPSVVSYMGRSKTPLKWCNNLHVYYAMVLTLKESTKRIQMDTSATLGEFFTRKYSWLNPRICGVTLKGKARLAFSRVAYST